MVISDFETLQPVVGREIRRSEELIREAEACTDRAFRAQARSRPGTFYARLEGMLPTGRSVAYVRRDGTVVSERALRRRMKAPARAVPAAGGAGRTSWPLDDAAAGNDPLATTVAAARCFDRMLGLELLVAGDRLQLGKVRAAASLEGPAHEAADGAGDHSGSTLAVDVNDVGDTHFVRLRGELDMATADFLHGTLVKVAGSTVVVDLSELRFIDAAGLSALMVSRRDITAAGHRFGITGANALVRKVFELTDLAHFLDD